MWDSGAAGDYGELQSEDNDSQEGIEEHDENEDDFCTDPPEQTDNESNVYKSFHFLEECSFIDFIETNGEFIITAGRDHDIKVWNAEKEVIVQRFIGHTAPITGIKIQSADPTKACSADLIVFSSSEDGSIREWSLQKDLILGKEIGKIETENIITCMDITPSRLAAIGNHKGHLEVYQLSTGQIYSSIVAHDDPIDAIMVNEVHICTAVYDRPGSLRVWHLKWGKVICMYSLEEIFSFEFQSFTLYGDLLILGDGTAQKLHILNYMIEDITDNLLLCEKTGYVQHVAVMEGLLLASTVNNDKMVHLHVYQLHDLDHLGTFYCKNMDRISSIMLIKNHALTFILGGSALAVLKLEFFPKQDIKSADSNSKSTNQTEEDLEINGAFQEGIDAYHPKDTNLGSLKDKNVNENLKHQSIQTSHCLPKQRTFESFSPLPPIAKSKEPKMQQKKDNKCKELESEYHLTEYIHLKNNTKIGGIPPDLRTEEKIQQETDNQNTTLTKEFDKLDINSSKNTKQPNEPQNEKEQKGDFTDLPFSNGDKNFEVVAAENDETNEHLQEKISQTLTQKQKYESEKVRIIKINKQQKEGRKHNRFQSNKKKQQINSEEGAQKKNKKKDCKIM